MNILLDGKTHQVSEGATGFDLFEDRSIVALKVNGEPKDLSYKLSEGDEVEGVSVSSDLGLSILRHSAAHVMAQAVQELFDEAKLGFDPVDVFLLRGQYRFEQFPADVVLAFFTVGDGLLQVGHRSEFQLEIAFQDFLWILADEQLSELLQVG